MVINSLDILGHSVKVTLEDDLARQHGKDGHFDPRKSEIKIDAGLTPDTKLSVLIHEVLEAIDTHLKLDLDHDAVLCKVEAALFQVIMANNLFNPDLLNNDK